MAALNFTDFAEEKVLDHTLRNLSYTPPTTVYAGLLSALNNDGQSVTELSGSGYARQAVTFSAASGGETTNSAQITYPVALEDWGSAAYVGIFDSLAGGNMLAWGEFSITKFISESAVFRIEASALDITAVGAFSLYLRNAILDHIFRNSTFTSPANVYIGIGATVDGLNTSISEPSGAAGYSRSSAVTFTSPGSGVSSNASSVSFLASGGNWGALDKIGIFDASSAGNLLYALDMDSSRSIFDTDGIDFDANAIEIRIK